MTEHLLRSSNLIASGNQKRRNHELCEWRLQFSSGNKLAVSPLVHWCRDPATSNRQPATKHPATAGRNKIYNSDTKVARMLRPRMLRSQMLRSQMLRSPVTTKKRDQAKLDPFFSLSVTGNYPMAFTYFINLLFKLEALFLCQVFFFASLSTMATTLGRYFTASALSSKDLNFAIAVLADFL